MAILRILTVPDPVLSQKSRPVAEEEFGPDLVQRMEDMAETMFAAPGVGLAAVQVGDLRRMLGADVGQDRDANGDRILGVDVVYLVNPVIVESSKTLCIFEEGGLSVPGFWEDFTRPDQARVRYRTPSGEEKERVFRDYPAVIIQHEMDHLDGVVILDNVSRLKRARYLSKVRKEAKRQSREAAGL